MNYLDYEEYKIYLKTLVDEEYKIFHSKIVTNIDNIMGIRMPEIKRIAKEISKTCYDDFIKIAKTDTFEELTILGLAIAYKKDLKDIAWFSKKITNWATCDSFCSLIKIKPKEKEIFLPIIKQAIQSDLEYEVRFGIVMLMDYYMDELEDAKASIELIKNIQKKDYYIQMAMSWAIQVCFMKNRDIALDILHQKSLDKFVQNTAIQKIRDSKRVCCNDKDLVSRYKV